MTSVALIKVFFICEFAVTLSSNKTRREGMLG